MFYWQCVKVHDYTVLLTTVKIVDNDSKPTNTSMAERKPESYTFHKIKFNGGLVL